MGKEARRLVERRFSWGRVGRELISAYEDVLNRSRRSSAWVERAP